MIFDDFLVQTFAKRHAHLTSGIRAEKNTCLGLHAQKH